jgi:hypothetical protein
VFAHIGDISPYWLFPALALKTCESVLIGLAWRNILVAAYPQAKVPFKTAWGATQGGTAINALAPAGGIDTGSLPSVHSGQSSWGRG